MRARHAVWGLVAAGLVLLAVVTVVPAIDLDASRAFYVPGHGFPWRTSDFGVVVRRQGPEILLTSLAACLVLWLVGVWRKRVVLGLTTRKIVYLLATLLIGPGLIVESLLKPHSGRARPQDLAMFGGSADYTAPLALADACASNCSFVSGHAAVAFWLTAYAFIVPREMRGPAFVLGLLIGIAVGAIRVMQGAHFVSDIVYAGAIVLTVNALLARLILADKNNGAA
jgi:lipid A 4'-phosphatase